MLPAADLVFVVVPVLIVVAWRSWHRVSPLQVVLRCVIVVYATGVVGVTMFPLPVLPDTIRLDRASASSPHNPYRILSGRDYNLVPGRGFVDVFKYAGEDSHPGSSYIASLWLFGKALLGNLVMLLPLGCLLPWLSVRLRRWWRTMAIVAATTLGIELLQLLGTVAYGFPYKRFDVDDIWLNLLGGLIGYGLYKLMAPMLGGRAKSKSGGQEPRPYCAED